MIREGEGMIRVALVEDDASCVAELTEHLKRYERESREGIHVMVFPDGEDIVTGYGANFDIILMDVEMAFMNGMKAARKIRKADSAVIIIFITNMPQYAIKGYEVDALDYILKPVSYFVFSKSMDRALARLKYRTKKYLTISVKGGMQKLDISKICYVEVRDHDLIYHTTAENCITRGVMRDAQKILENHNFFRCNRCYLVNLEHVDNFRNGDALWQMRRLR